ncbi:chain A, active ribosome inactivating protein [Tanacetum coccineum]|uniref:Chain A, active ribosome inactivating protein n=1 Tax=Tanacetum coccineum TaxID=301880 RepID=A0ABQ4XSW1_9ASTR
MARNSEWGRYGGEETASSPLHCTDPSKFNIITKWEYGWGRLKLVTSEEGWCWNLSDNLLREQPGDKCNSSFLVGERCNLDFAFSHSLTVVKIGYQALKHALMEIIKGGCLADHALIAGWMNHIAPLMLTILVMLPESVRFKWHFVTIRRMMNQGAQYAGDEFVTDWMGSDIKNWEFASGVAFGRMAISTRLPPPGHLCTMDDLGIAYTLDVG